MRSVRVVIGPSLRVDDVMDDCCRHCSKQGGGTATRWAKSLRDKAPRSTTIRRVHRRGRDDGQSGGQKNGAQRCEIPCDGGRGVGAATWGRWRDEGLEGRGGYSN